MNRSLGALTSVMIVYEPPERMWATVIGDDLNRIMGLAPPPEDGPYFDNPGRLDGVVDGDALVRLPRDYVQLIRTYGCGLFNDYLYVHVPNSKFPVFDFESLHRDELASLVDAPQMRMPAGMSQQNPDLYLWGRTEDCDMFWWHTQPRDSPDKWRVVCNKDLIDWYVYDMNTCEFLYNFLTDEQCGMQDESPFFLPLHG